MSEFDQLREYRGENPDLLRWLLNHGNDARKTAVLIRCGVLELDDELRFFHQPDCAVWRGHRCCCDVLIDLSGPLARLRCERFGEQLPRKPAELAWEWPLETSTPRR